MEAFDVASLDSFLQGGITIAEPGNENSNTWLDDFLDFPVESSVGHNLEQPNEMKMTEKKMGPEFFSQETQIPSNCNSSLLYKTLLVPGTPFVPVIDSLAYNVPPLFAQISNFRVSGDHRAVETSTSRKQRLRWTTELHGLFLDAIAALGGLERATPKKILETMNVVGLTIFQVKTHLQKYRTLVRKTSISDQEKNAAVQSDMESLNRLHLQLKVQKELHEQLQMHQELLQRILQNVELLRKLTEEEQNSDAAKSHSKCLKRFRGDQYITSSFSF